MLARWLLMTLVLVLLAPPAWGLQPRTRPNRDAVSPGSRPNVPRRRRPRRPRRPRPPKPPPAEDLDRAVVRWHARGTSGQSAPRFITARELAFEARLEALAAHTTKTAPYTNKDLRAALQRHISENMLASLPVDPKPTPKQVATYAEFARKHIVERIASEIEGPAEAKLAYGLAKMDEARRAEGISREELDALLRRRARASWYLDRMVAPMLRPSELDLREAHRRGETPFTQQPFDEVKDPIERWYVSARLQAALERYFTNVRSRVTVVVIGRPPQVAASGDEKKAKRGQRAKRRERTKRRARARKRARRRDGKRATTRWRMRTRSRNRGPFARRPSVSRNKRHAPQRAR